jgi:hypothetical protein
MLTYEVSDNAWRTLEAAYTVARPSETASAAVTRRNAVPSLAAPGSAQHLVIRGAAIGQAANGHAAALAASVTIPPEQAAGQFPSLNRFFNNPSYDQLAMDLRQLISNSAIQSAKVDHLAKTVSMLNAAVNEVSNRLHQHSLDVTDGAEMAPAAALVAAASLLHLSTADVISRATSDGMLADLLNLVADEGASDEAAFTAVAQAQLTSPEAVLRAAAARALSRLSPALATAALPDLIKVESDRMARAVMKGALEAAS